MAKVDLISQQWCDIVFEGRNKDYGAYRMRAAAGRRNRVALIWLLIGLFAIGAIIVVNNVVQDIIEANRTVDNTETTAFSELEQQKEDKKEDEKKEDKIEYEKPQEEKVAVKASIQFTVPKIVDDDKVQDDKKLKTQEEVTKSSFAVASQDYAGDSKNGINIDDLKENQSAGGTKVPPKEEEIFTIVEQEAEYPGGEQALLAYVRKNCVYPQIAQEQDIQGTVQLRFVVEKDGSVGEVKVVKSLHPACDKEAVRVVKTLKRFTPAKQQGHPVRAWFTLPVRFSIQ
jgi:protein TonB